MSRPVVPAHANSPNGLARSIRHALSECRDLALDEIGSDRQGLFAMVADSNAEDFLRRVADDRAKIVDHMRLVGKATGIGDIRPGRSALPHGQHLLDACDPRKMLR